jgi:hypothetical protein
MTQIEMDKLMQHFEFYFHQNDCVVVHPVGMEPHIDALLYKPNDMYPYWKLVTMGASDHEMQAPTNALGNRNEYIMFIDPSEDMTSFETVCWYYQKLLKVANYSMHEQTFISYGHSIEWECSDEEEMSCAFLEMPQIVEDVGILRCKLDEHKTVICLQVILLNKKETDVLLRIGHEQFSSFLYPEDGDCHFICERIRSDRF